jgi:hypothetical protein
MVKELKKRITQVQKSLEAFSGDMLAASATRVRQLKRELDRLARRLDALARRRARAA